MPESYADDHGAVRAFLRLPDGGDEARRNLADATKWFRDLDSNQDTQLQRLMSYRLDDPGTAEKSLAERFPFAQAEGAKMLQTIRRHRAAKRDIQLHGRFRRTAISGYSQEVEMIIGAHV